MLHVDLERREIRASVRALAAWPPDPPRPGGWLARARIQLGIDVHRAYRCAREGVDPCFEAEVGVRLEHRVDGFLARVRGRLDGLVRRNGRLLVEEVKSSPDVRPEHFFQLRLYALCLARKNPAAAVAGRLLLAGRTLDVDCDPARTTRELEARLRGVIAAARREQERARERAELAEGIEFPYAQRRPGQSELMAAVELGLAKGRPVLAAAPTGIGKTVSALLPALRFALRQNAMLFFLTAKTTQQALVARTFRDLAPPGLRAVTLRAKARMCPPRTLLCHPEPCAHLASFLDAERRAPVLARLLEGDGHLEPATTRAEGERAGVCPYALSMALCGEADLVIGDYNYVYGHSPLSMFGDDWTGRGAVIVADEAHNLFDRARGYDSPFLSLPEVPREGPAFLGRLRAFLEATIRAADGPAVHGSRPFPVRRDDWNELAADAVRLAVELVRRAEVRVDDPLLDTIRKVVRLRDLLLRDEPELVPYARDSGIGVLCVNPARRLAERHRQVAGTVAMSATLEPIAYYRDVLGFGELDPVEIACPSPFPARNRCVALVPNVSTTYADRASHYASIAETIERVVAVRPGRYAVYFPSFRFLDAVRAHLRLPRVLAQHSAMDGNARSRLLADLGREPAVLLAVLGGVFAEGIDLPGDGLIGAIVVGPGLPQVGFERTLMRRYFQATTGRGFAFAMLYPGLQRVIQAAGRVHRRPDDRGVIVLLGRRFAQRPYALGLPPHWRLVHTPDPRPLLGSFWRR